jgi:endonuclease/exonuclease/phosphatase (EEP) superfamily protein YafD
MASREVMEARSRRRSQRRRRSPINSFISFWVCGGVAVLTLLIGFGSLGGVFPALDLASHFQAIYFVCAIAGFIACALLRRWRWMVLAMACAALTGMRVVPWYLGGSAPANVEGEPLRVLLINVRTTNDRDDDVLALVRAEDPDLIVLHEVNERWMNALESLRTDYPYVLSGPREDNFGIALFSRLPLANESVFRTGTFSLPSLRANVALENGATVELWSTHPLPPISISNTAERDAQLEAVAERIAKRAGPRLLVGDLNATMWSAPYRDLVGTTGLHNARRGHGLLPTWPMSLPALTRIPIDHCLHTDDIAVASIELGPDIGSDHRPVVVELIVPDVRPES